MKYFLKIIAPLFIAIILYSCGDDSVKMNVEDKSFNYVELDIKVDGMTCGGCEKSINNELLKLNGVGQVVVSHVNKNVLIQVDTSVTSQKDLENTIERVGYVIIK